ncbi:unnamed protein product [Strongylus vulgaris]|uniref:Uncharacterized protein n=1 Tax=Strongylus vulgaris TaxID=40348 RepID=A0A3P7LNA7_STRVU|nr:unnamed protein product [Strongylus vulgaris]
MPAQQMAFIPQNPLFIPPDTPPATHPAHEVPEDDDENENDISIETTQDGMLKLCCSDPQVLQAAQEALSEYLRARAKPSAEEREKRKERRKSMPLQASHQEQATAKVDKKH